VWAEVSPITATMFNNHMVGDVIFLLIRACLIGFRRGVFSTLSQNSVPFSRSQALVAALTHFFLLAVCLVARRDVVRRDVCAVTCAP